MKPPLAFASPPRSILVVCPRRIGDVLLTTPLVRSLKRHWPDAAIDMVVFRGTEGVLEGNPDIRRVITVARKASARERFADAMRLWRRYDLAFAAISSDRARFYAWFGSRTRIGLVDAQRITRLTRGMLTRLAPDLQRTSHVVSSCLSLAPLVGVAPVGEVVAPSLAGDPERLARLRARLTAAPASSPGQPLAVVHPSPMYAYKQWRVDGWADTIRWLRAQGFAVALSGGPGDAERRYAEQVAEAAGEPVVNMVGELSFAETAEMIRAARVFVGPDTGATHVAAACGTPTVALFGPSDPVRWGPWPDRWDAGEAPWVLRGTQRRGNVVLLQGEGECVPCREEGCERRIDSESACLTLLPAARVIGAISALLALPADAAGADAAPGVRVPVPVVIRR